jgi:hypothetical protein
MLNRWIGHLKLLLWITCRLWLVGGVIALVTGCGLAIYQSVWLSRTSQASGLVVQLIPTRDAEQSVTSYAPRFTFKDETGRTYTVTSHVRTSPPEFGIGERVGVRYIKSDPSSAKLEGFWQLWLAPFVCVILGVFFTGAGYLFLRLEKRFLYAAIPI